MCVTASRMKITTLRPAQMLSSPCHPGKLLGVTSLESRLRKCRDLWWKFEVWENNRFLLQLFIYCLESRTCELCDEFQWAAWMGTWAKSHVLESLIFSWLIADGTAEHLKESEDMELGGQFVLPIVWVAPQDVQDLVFSSLEDAEATC